MRTRWLVLIALLLVPALASARERIAVVVGSNGAPVGRKPLRYAYEDVAQMVEVLRLAGFASTDIHVMKDPEPSAVLATLDRALGEKPSQLIFYYSGHADTSALYPNGKSLSLARLRDRLDNVGALVRIGIIDACRGGGWTGTKGLTPTNAFAITSPFNLSNEGSVLISSSSGLEDAHESELLRGSYFTHHWVAGLRGAADHDSDGTITLGEAFAYAKELTVRDTALHTRAPQHPSFHLNLRGKHDLALVTLSAARSVLTVEQRVGPLQLVHLDSGVVVLEAPPGKRRLRLALPPGRYIARRQTATKLYARELVVDAGKETRLDEEDLTLVGTSQLAVKGGEPARAYLALGIGGGMLTGTEMEPSSSGVSWTIQLGYRVARPLHLLMSGDFISFTRYAPDPSRSQQQGALTLGILWTPRQPVYVKAGLGVAHLIQQDYGSLWSVDQGAWGGAITAGLGVSIYQDESFGLAVEAADSFAIYGGSTRHELGFNLLARIWR